jgi:transcriptional regulator with XRE-family HTH domain
MALSLLQTLRDARHKSGHSLSRMAALTGLNLSQISQIENENVDPRLSSVRALAGALDYELVLVPRQRALEIATLLVVPEPTAASGVPPSIAERLRIDDR